MTDLYYRIKKGSETWGVIQAIKDSREEYRKAINALYKKLGLQKGQQLWANQGCAPFGVKCDFNMEMPSDGWVYVRKHGVWKPRRDTEKGKEIKALMDAVPHVVSTDILSQKLFQSGLVFGREGGSPVLRWAVFGYTERGAVVRMHSSVKKAAKHWPKGLKEITGSEAARIMGEKD